MAILNSVVLKKVLWDAQRKMHVMTINLILFCKNSNIVNFIFCSIVINYCICMEMRFKPYYFLNISGE